MSNRDFYIGQKLVCISDKYPNKDITPIKEGVVYTFDGIPPEFPRSIYIKEVPPFLENGKPVRYSYGAIRFAPITETYADMTSEIAAKAKETEEKPDVRKIKEPVNN